MPQMFPMPISILAIMTMVFLFLSMIRFFWHWKQFVFKASKQQVSTKMKYYQTW